MCRVLNDRISKSDVSHTQFILIAAKRSQVNKPRYLDSSQDSISGESSSSRRFSALRPNKINYLAYLKVMVVMC